MPVRNNQKTVALALQSIIAQTYSHWELLLIDDGSADDTLRIISGFSDRRIKVLSDGRSLGLPARLNQAIELCQGNYLARMDGDDICYPHRLEAQVHYLQRHEEIDLVGGSMLIFGDNGRPIGKRVAPEKHASITKRPYRGFPVAHPTFLGRLEWFRRYGYRTDAVRCEDQDMLLRAYKESTFANVQDILLGYREEKVDLRKTLTSRIYFTRSLVKEMMRRKRFDLATRAVVEQQGKMLMDVAAVTTGLHHRLLRHRAYSISTQEAQKWQEVWNMVNNPE